MLGRGARDGRGDRFAARLAQVLPDATKRVEAARVIAKTIEDLKVIETERKVMSSLAGVADRIKAKKALHASKYEDWAARLDKLDQLEPDAFASTEASVAALEADLSGMEADMRALTNGAPTQQAAVVPPSPPQPRHLSPPSLPK